MIRISVLAFFIIVLTGTLGAQVISDTFAVVGNKVITKNEFLQRYEFTPKLQPSTEGIEDALKKELIYTLTAEKLFSSYAGELQLDTLPVFRAALKRVETMYVRDALYREEIKQKAEPTIVSFIQEYINRASTLTVQYVLSATREKADLLVPYVQNMEEGKPSFSTLPKGSPDVQSMNLSFPADRTPLIDTLFTTPVGKYTIPFEYQNGWGIFYIAGRTDTLFTGKEENSAVFDRIRKVSEEAATQFRYNEFRQEFFKGKKFSTDAPLFKSLVRSVFTVLQKNYSERKDTVSEPVFTIDFRDAAYLKSIISPDTLQMVYIDVSGAPVTVSEFIDFLIEEPIQPNTLSLNAVAAELAAKGKLLIEYRLLAEEGYKRGLDKLPEVQFQVSLWRDHLLSESFLSSLINHVQVSDDEVLAYYNKRSARLEKSDYYNIAEILTDSLSIIETALKKIEDGADFSELAKLYSNRSWTKATNGEFGYFTSDMYGEIGAAVPTMEIGQVYGPVKVPEGYSLFKLIDKKPAEVFQIGEFAVMKEKLRTDIAYAKYKQSLLEQTADLAVRYGVTIDWNSIAGQPVSPLQSIVYRHFGFGGKMIAVPLTRPYTEWVDEWKRRILQAQ